MTDEAPARPPWMPSELPDGDPPLWDQEDADSLVGQLVLAGITYLAADGETVESQVQYYGRIVSAKPDDGISIACEGKLAGQTMTLPPNLQAFQSAKPGEYRLRSTGEIVVDPDLTTTWTIRSRVKS